MVAGNKDNATENNLATLSEFGAYPNLLNLTDADRALFHPVMVFKGVFHVLDFTAQDGERQLATPQEVEQSRQGCLGRALTSAAFSVGRYDEDRVGVYESELFNSGDNAEKRTIHMGVDLGGPIGTPVYNFFDGVVMYSGYRSSLGDYGNLIITEHTLPNRRKVYALYGHLDASVNQWKSGDCLQTGQMLARIGSIHENGGYLFPVSRNMFF